MPVIGYSNKVSDEDRESYLVGFGAGIGYVNASGDVILTEETGQPREEFSFNKIGYSLYLILEYRWDEHTIWGLTGRILNEFLTLARELNHDRQFFP